MCGIVAYIGNKEAYPILINGLKRLEYRGYDSAGVAILSNDESLQVFKKEGRVKHLKDLVEKSNVSGTIGIGHTRWATHGPANDENAHPHYSQSQRLAIIHNGIIENYHALKTDLIKRGYEFKSDTDTEVIAHLIEEIKTTTNADLEEAVRLALSKVAGAYAIVVISQEEPDKLIAAKMSSPMVIGYGDGEFYVGSDGAPIVEHTRKVSYMEDGQMVVMNRDGSHYFKSIKDNTNFTPFVDELVYKLEELEKDGFEHFMLKEIYEQPRAIRDSIRGRIDPVKMFARLGGIYEYEQTFLNAERIIFVACGTSWHAALIAEYLLEDLARIPVEVEYASEFRYRNPIITEKDIVIAISQSGETADTKAALELARAKGAMIYGICNVVGSAISRMTDAGSYTHAGPEIGVASTKAFTTQVAVLSIMALELAKRKGAISRSRFQLLLAELDSIPEKVEAALQCNDTTKIIADIFQDASNFLYLGRGYNFPVALEGALKLKEISYIHAEGYPAAEMKHGPIALIDENMPVLVIATNRGAYEKVVSNMEEIKARKGKIIAVVTEGDEDIARLADFVIPIPETEEPFTPLLAAIPLQLLAYHIALMRGCDVDQPRNLAKSVTVE